MNAKGISQQKSGAAVNFTISANRVVARVPLMLMPEPLPLCPAG